MLALRLVTLTDINGDTIKINPTKVSSLYKDHDVFNIKNEIKDCIIIAMDNGIHHKIDNTDINKVSEILINY